MMRYFTVTHGDRSYAVMAGTHATIETVWASQKCWFMPGSVVTVKDDIGNKKTFRA